MGWNYSNVGGVYDGGVRPLDTREVHLTPCGQYSCHAHRFFGVVKIIMTNVADIRSTSMEAVSNNLWLQLKYTSLMIKGVLSELDYMYFSVNGSNK